MNRISRVFSTGEKPLIVYLTAGFPRPGADEALALEAVDAGARMLELGFPFSDPVADGPLIQEASRTALGNGMTLAGTLELAARLRTRSDVPILLMGYANPVFCMGFGQFVRRAAEAGVDGAIIPDLPMEEAAPLRDAMRGSGLALIPMAAPTTPSDRLAAIVESGDGFLYLVSMAGLTGDLIRDGSSWVGAAREARTIGRLPVCVGFGIRTGDDAARAAREADGVIVGTAVTAEILAAADEDEARRKVSRLVKDLADAIA